MESFNQHKVGSYSELPEDKKEKFAPLGEGKGFAEKAALDKQTELEESAKELNKSAKSFFTRVLGIGRLDFEDVGHMRALETNEMELAKIEVRKIRESMPQELKEKMKTAEFTGKVFIEGGGEKVVANISGLDQAIENVGKVGILFWHPTSGIVDMKLIYNNNDTHAEVSGQDDGWAHPVIEVKIKHNGQSYEWIEFAPESSLTR